MYLTITLNKLKIYFEDFQLEYIKKIQFSQQASFKRIFIRKICFLQELFF